MAHDFERLEIVVQNREGILFAWKVVEGDVARSVELLERVKNVESMLLCRLVKSQCCRIGMKVPRLHVKDTRCSLELRLVNSLLEALSLQIEIATPHLRLALVAIFTREVAPQGGRVLLQNARHKARTDRQRLVLKNFF